MRINTWSQRELIRRLGRRTRQRRVLLRTLAGPVPAESFRQNHDIRFTAKGKTLYAIALAWPQDGKLVVKSLAGGTPKPRSVSLLGNRGNLKWTQTAEGLVVTMPSNKPREYAYALKIDLL